MNNQPMTSDQSNRLLAALGYPIWIIALVIILTDMKKDAFMKHHGWTALFWGLAWAVIYVALAVLANIPVLGWIGAFLLGPVIWLAWLILSLYYAYQTYNGKTFSIPIVSDFAKKYAT